MDIIKNFSDNPYEYISNLEINDLERVIQYSADKYYNTSESVISDEIYDILIDFLRLKNPKSKVLKQIGAKVVGKNKVKLDYWLGSMDKIKPGYRELDKWLEKYPPNYILSDKLDGISALVIYRDNKKINLYTRGTANEGLDITPLVKYLNLPEWDKVNSLRIKALRGELIIDKNIFNNNWAQTLKNARNAVSGLVNSKNINPRLASDTKLVVYEILDPIMTMEEQLKLIDNAGFNIVDYIIVNNITFNILSDYLRKRRSESKYFIDGIIVTNNGLHTKNIKGNPEYAFAFKDVLEDQKGITKVINIEWNISKDGLIKPTLIIEPINIGGVQINRVTAHNAKYIVDNKIGKNTEIEIIRSGDVIPYIQKIIKSSRTPDLPNGDWHWNETGVDIISDNLESDEILIKNIYYFFSSLNTKGLGEKIVEKLVNSGLNSILKIIKGTQEDFLNVEGFKEKSAENLVNSIKTALTNVSLAKLMSASNKLGHGLGEERMKQILLVYPNILTDSSKWSKQEFIEKIKLINGWEEKTSTLFVSNFNDFIKFYNSIKDYITIESSKKQTKGKYTNKTIVLSGFRDAELQQKLENMGAKISNSISKNTDLLIVKDIDEITSKITKAKELNIPIVSSKDLVF